MGGGAKERERSTNPHPRPARKFLADAGRPPQGQYVLQLIQQKSPHIERRVGRHPQVQRGQGDVGSSLRYGGGVPKEVCRRNGEGEVQ